MEHKTKVRAEEGRQELFITREFDLPVELLFKAYAEADFVARWMGTKVLKLENKTHGSWQYETKDGEGKVVFRANGTIHEFIPNRKIVRTFEMEHAPFSVQLEFLEFKKLTDRTSMLSIHTVFRSVQHRDDMLKLPFAYGINMAHNRLEDIMAGRE
ncbi:SRPBCC domain-containing protein [Sinomicrobium soli]|uniref:SRPBCC domain-containing protein n=1 Tax=Sinomicrobium sp. N-1-3-6 TaxID=2219864 RepID=UPI000DCE05DB|nr:SRPBCC domain-containing protein [Sinomicrobium sp. N-1-3-6]RAV29315.1 ATPase [Sinomicrobium sp. N-1-3-6]